MASSAPLTTRLRAAIVNSTYLPGERLVESDLMEQFDATRRSVRDALAELDKEGLVLRTANRGASVRKISLEEAIEITEVRALLEGLIAAQAARQATEEERESLTAIIERMRIAAAEDPIGSFQPLYSEFHQLLRSVGRHEVASELVETLRNRNAQFQFRTALIPGRVEASLSEHEAIAAAVVTGDSEAARKAMHRHLEAVVEALQAWSRAGTFL